jgi:hypothetical protein
MKLKTLGSIYSKFDTNGRMNLEEHQPHVRLPEIGNIHCSKSKNILIKHTHLHHGLNLDAHMKSYQ